MFAQIPYGNNPIAGNNIVLNGVRHYYESYGKGQALLLIHGNSTGIPGWAPQISFFEKYYTVYVIDCRGRGHSDLGKDSLSYKQMADDMAEFIKKQSLDSVLVVGKSDGGIVGLMMGIYHPEHIQKIVAFGANAEPDSFALKPSAVIDAYKSRAEAERKMMDADTSQNWPLIYQRNRMMECQPHITAEELHKIPMPVLIMSCDRDLIKEEHSLWLYKNIPLAHLAILAGENHFVARQKPELFNQTVIKFLQDPYKGEAFRNQR